MNCKTCSISWCILIIKHGLLENPRFIDDFPSYKPYWYWVLPFLVYPPMFTGISSSHVLMISECLPSRNPTMLRMMKQTVNDGYGMSFKDGCENEQNVAYKYYKDCWSFPTSWFLNMFDVAREAGFIWIPGSSQIFSNNFMVSPDTFFFFRTIDANNQNISMAKFLFSNTPQPQFALFQWCTPQLFIGLTTMFFFGLNMVKSSFWVGIYIYICIII